MASRRWFTPTNVGGLAWITAVLGAVGLGSAALVAAWTTGDLSGPQELARRTLDGPLSWLLFGALATGGLALALAAVERRLRDRPRTLLRPSVRPLGAGTNREALDEVRARVAALAAASAGEPDVSPLLDELLIGAMRLSASDLHVRPARDGIRLTYRVDGLLADVGTLPKEIGPRLTTRIKVLSRLDPFAHRPLDGRLWHRISGQQLEARVSTLPTELGDRVVLRLIHGAESAADLAALGLDPSLTQQLTEEVLARPEGLFLVSGPVGSGKTTTLYSALGFIHASRGQTASLVTLEDPIERHLVFATQTQINAQQGLTFAQALRSALRQDPNVLMLGEIRDRETAQIATQAGLTGHLILSTLHVDRAAGTFPRLVEMGVEPFVLSSTMLGAMSQRLVRALCTHCRRPAALDPFVESRLAQLSAPLPAGEYCDPVGCDFCEQTGFEGRLPLAELLVVGPTLRALLAERRSTEEIQRAAVDAGMIPLLQSGVLRASRGETSLSEVLRVVG